MCHGVEGVGRINPSYCVITSPNILNIPGYKNTHSSLLRLINVLGQQGVQGLRVLYYFDVYKRVYLHDKSSLLSLSNACAPCNHLILFGLWNPCLGPALSACQLSTISWRDPLQMVASVVLDVTGGFVMCMEGAACCYCC